MADIIVERDTDRTERTGSNMGVIVGIVAVVILVLLALFWLPSIVGTDATTNPLPEATAPTTTAN